MGEWLLLLATLLIVGLVLRPYDSTGESWVGYWVCKFLRRGEHG